ncbi:MAG TPA: IS481 family transposase, partial [Oscillatoriaceae cyanobacterium]
PIEYGPGDQVRKVATNGFFSYKNRLWKLGKAFHTMPVAVRYTEQDGAMDVYFCAQKVKTIDLRALES